jgi:hypothetical protein
MKDQHSIIEINRDTKIIDSPTAPSPLSSFEVIPIYEFTLFIIGLFNVQVVFFLIRVQVTEKQLTIELFEVVEWVLHIKGETVYVFLPILPVDDLELQLLVRLYLNVEFESPKHFAKVALVDFLSFGTLEQDFDDSVIGAHHSVEGGYHINGFFVGLVRTNLVLAGELLLEFHCFPQSHHAVEGGASAVKHLVEDTPEQLEIEDGGPTVVLE